MHDITRTLDAMTATERASFHRSLESSDHFDRMDGIMTGYTVEFANLPVRATQRVAINALLDEVEPGLRIGDPMSQRGAARLIAAYFSPQTVTDLMSR